MTDVDTRLRVADNICMAGRLSQNALVDCYKTKTMRSQGGSIEVNRWIKKPIMKKDMFATYCHPERHK